MPIERTTSFQIEEKNSKIGPSPCVAVTLKVDWKSDIKTEGQHLALPVTLKMTEPESVISICVSLKDVSVPGEVSSADYPAQGFPGRI